MRHVLWIGGPPGTGKTSIARRLAAEHDVRVYHADAHTWAHHDRALARGFPATAAWEEMSPDERWVSTPPERMAEQSLALSEDRFRLMLEDLRAFPCAPLVVAEGTPLLPWLVANVLETATHAVWLLPTPEFQRRLLAARPATTFHATSDPPRAAENRLRRELLVGEAIQRGARQLGFRTLVVDGSSDLPEMQEACRRHFAAVLERGPRATTADGRRALRRDENLRHLGQLLTYLERVPAAGRPDVVEHAFACECGRSGCREEIRLSVANYELLVKSGAALTDPSHGREIL